jgi:hypothetical protein
MKTNLILFSLCFACATAAFGQSANVLSNTPAPTVMADHPLHASQHAMGTESSLLGSFDSPYEYARGERPMSDFASAPKPEIPLGDIARAYRKDHEVVRKASIVVEK